MNQMICEKTINFTLKAICKSTWPNRCCSTRKLANLYKIQGTGSKESQDNLDYLQKANKKHRRDQQQPKKLVAPAPPIGMQLASRILILNILLTLCLFFFPFPSLNKKSVHFFFCFRIVGQVFDADNSAANDGDSGEDDRGPISMVRQSWIRSDDIYVAWQAQAHFSVFFQSYQQLKFRI